MIQGWIAVVLVAFGIFVALFGVIAYLRLIKTSKRQSGQNPALSDCQPPAQGPPGHPLSTDSDQKKE